MDIREAFTGIHVYLENIFEKITLIFMKMMGNSIVFLLALGLVVFWITGHEFSSQTLHSKLENIIVSLTFLTLFMIQKEFKKFKTSLHIKLNELIATNTIAQNKLMSVEEKTESEMEEITKIYAESAAADQLETDADPKQPVIVS
jgi:low affinity Fe/Cu permease